MQILNSRIQNLLPEDRDYVIKEISFSGKRHRPFYAAGGAILLCLEGEAEIIIDGKSHDISERNEVILPDGCTLFIKRCSQDMRMLSFVYSKEISYQAMHKFEPSFFPFISAEPVHRHTEESMASTMAYMQILSALQNDAHNHFRSLIATNLLRCIMLNIYDKLKRKGKLDSDTFHTRKEEIYSNFISLIMENAKRHREVSYYADKLCISARHLSSITKDVTGETPKQTIDEFLITEIKLMLTFSDMSIQQIADYLHFPDQSYFGRFFKRFTGMSPQSYRMKEMTM